MHDLEVIVALNDTQTPDTMTAAYEHVAKLYKELSAELAKTPANQKKCSDLLDALKVLGGAEKYSISRCSNHKLSP